MKHESTMLAGAVLIVLSLPAYSDINIVTVNKVSKNLYQSSDGKFIETSGCYAEAENDKAVLIYEKYACNNTIRFSTKRMCEVLDVYGDSSANETNASSPLSKLKTGI